jgi:hypothetical protein
MNEAKGLAALQSAHSTVLETEVSLHVRDEKEKDSLRMTARNLALTIIGTSILASTAEAKTWHTSPSGEAASGLTALSDAEAGAMAGDTIWLHAGTYREPLRPARSGTPAAPIVFLGAPGEVATLTGLDSIGGWSQGNDGIWNAPAPSPITQLFQDRAPMPEARYPNTGRDLFHPATVPLSMADSTASSSALSMIDNSWKGATVWALVDQRWISQTGIVGSAAAGVLALSSASSGGQTGSGIGYVGGVLAALDTAGEWLWRNDTLYFLPDSGKAPAQILVEGKTRTWAIDLSSRTDIVVQGLNILAGGANLSKSRRCRLDGLSMRYLSHFRSPVTAGYTSSWTRWKGINISVAGVGVGVFGDSNTVRGCDLQWSAGDGITVYGNGNLIENNLVSKTDYSGSDMNGISIYGNGNRITRNTVDSCGRGCIFLFGGGTERVDHNLVFDNGLIDWDVGGIYLYGVDGQGTSIDHNWVHDSHSGDPSHLGFGIYVDNFNSNLSVHHNVIWNCDHNAMNYSRPAVDVTWTNNTVFNAKNVTSSYLHPSATVDSSRGNRLWNNLMTTSYATSGTFSALDQSHNVRLSILPLQDPSNFDFRPNAGSAAIDAGVSILGIDDSVVGKAPDAGAYELGGVFWKAGAGSIDSSAPPTAIPSARPGERTAWELRGRTILAGAPCDLRIMDPSGRELERFHLEAGQSRTIGPMGCGLLLIADGRAIRKLSAVR